jgi:hypothetical protein
MCCKVEGRWNCSALCPTAMGGSYEGNVLELVQHRVYCSRRIISGKCVGTGSALCLLQWEDNIRDMCWNWFSIVSTAVGGSYQGNVLELVQHRVYCSWRIISGKCVGNGSALCLLLGLLLQHRPLLLEM